MEKEFICIFKNSNLFLINNKLYFVLFIWLSIIFQISSDCSNGIAINETDCFNDLIIIKQYYKSGNFATNKKGDMIIEYSNSGSTRTNQRLFYGIKKNGRYFFSGEKAYREKEVNHPDPNININARYEARNIFVSLEDDKDKEKEYLFSTSSYDTLTELHDLENDTYTSKGTIEYFNIRNVFSFEYSLFGSQESNKNYYYFIFTQNEAEKVTVKKDGVDQELDWSETYIIKKFKFTSFDLSSYNEINSVICTDNYNDRVISSFILEKFQILVVFFLKKADNNLLNGQYAMHFYDLDLNKKNEIIFSENITDPRSGDGVFFKCVYLKEEYASFVYFTKGYDETKVSFNVSKFSKTTESSNDIYSFTTTITKNLEDIQSSFISDVPLNDFVKVDDKRLIFISTVRGSQINSETGQYNFNLHFIFLDLYNNYQSLKTRHFYFDLSGHQIRNELFGHIYNGYFVFTATVVTPQSYTSGDFFSILIFFGYANGTDFGIDISPYLMDVEGYDPSKNLFNLLIEKLVIDNNIFEYEKIDKINLASIPDELLFYNLTDGNKDLTKLIHNNEFFDNSHFLAQNFDINKTNKYYYLDYQYIVQEPAYDTFYDSTKKNVVDDGNYKSEFTRKIFYGRTNRLKFKLCYEYCETCLEFGKTIDDQKCLTCLQPYTYDYWHYLPKYIPNCIPENKFYDDVSKQVINCDSTFNYFYPEADKKICFKSGLDCPNDFPYLNTTTKECQNKLIPVTTIIEKIPSTPIEKEPSTTIEKPMTTITPLKPSTIPDVIQSTFIPTISTTIFSPSCSFNSYKNNSCSFENESDEGILSKLREILDTYPAKGAKLTVNSHKGYAFQIAETLKEKKLINPNNFSAIYLGECEQKLKDHYQINTDEPLIVLTFEKLTNNVSEKYVQYEVYNPITFDKLELSVCEDTEIDIYIPLNLSEEAENLYKDLMEQGYDPFNINDKFYREICTPYKSENGTDVLLDDREEYIYNSIANETQCPDNCEYSAYLLDEKYIKCECNINTTGLDTLDLNHINGKNIYKSFKSTMKYSNYKVMRCYNLVFNIKIFLKNYGSIGTLLIFLIYIIFIIYYAIKGISSLKVNISKLMFETQKITNNDELKIIPDDKHKRIEKEKMKHKTNYPHKNKGKLEYPPKRNSTKKLTKATMIIKETEDVEFIPMGDVKNQKGKRKSFRLKSKAEKNRIGEHQIQNLKTSGDEMNENKEKELKENKKKTRVKLDNFELNNLDYEEASDLDKRSCCTTYFSVLMREHLVLLTFFSWKDYNIFYVKIERFFISICTDMTMNGLFFIHESMHKKYAENEDFTFIQKLPQLLFTLLVSHALEVIICYFSMTDTAFYEIKSLPKTKENQEKIINIIDCVKNKLIAFYIFTFLLFLFYWYFISAFCAVYQNTQIIFLRDSAISFLISCIDPFIIYAFTCILRAISLSRLCRKKLCCIYKLSDIIPIF